jgi:hypothetical protein
MSDGDNWHDKKRQLLGGPAKAVPHRKLFALSAPPFVLIVPQLKLTVHLY